MTATGSHGYTGAWVLNLGPVARTSLRGGVRQTIAGFERVLREGRLDVREPG